MSESPTRSKSRQEALQRFWGPGKNAVRHLRAPFEPRRRAQRFCSAACRQRGFAQAQVDELRQMLAALATLRERLEADITRWENRAAGHREARGRGA